MGIPCEPARTGGQPMKSYTISPKSLLPVLLTAAALVSAIAISSCSRSGVDSLTGPAHSGAVAFAKGPGQAGTPPPPPPPGTPPPAADPCVSLTGFGGTVVNAAAEVPQNRLGRLRIEITGDVAAGTMLRLGNCSTNAVPTVTFISGRATASSGGGLSASDTFGAIAQVPGEPGVLVGTAANGDVLEIIWPGLA